MSTTDARLMMTAVGLMSGTSLDGVDVALIETDGERVSAFGPARSYPYSDTDRALFFRAIEDARRIERRDDRPGCLAEAEARITKRHAEALLDFLGWVRRPVDIVGFHGQTVVHRPERRLTVQIGDGPQLFAAVQRSPHAPHALVYDLRAADVAAGGQGAPLVPVYHRALLKGLDRPGPVLVLNLGGVANITFIDDEDEPVACDTGPANALIDDFVKLRTGAAYDAGGRIAAAGQVHESVLGRWMEHPFFRLAPPKSLDRNDFREWVADRGGLDDLTVEDGAATLTALTAACIGAVLPLLPRRPRTIIVAGGGAHNATLLRMIGERSGLPVERADALGWDGDALEAQAFAFLAVRRVRDLPISFPGTTGVPAPLTGGTLISSLPKY